MNNKLKWMMTNNFGDDLSPHIFKFITGVDAEHVSHNYSKDCLVMIGSILNWSVASNKVWGSGLAQRVDKKIEGNFYAVRGPLTRQNLLEHDVDCPDVYGDPAILLPKYYNPSVEKKYKLGIAPHIIDHHHIHIDHPQILKINLKDNWQTVIKQILSCENIVSSSLHGLIVADAYNIPSLWCEFSDRVIGRGFKFHDYYQSIGIKNPEYCDLRQVTKINDLNLLKKFKKYDILDISDRLLESFPLINIKK